MVFSEPLTQVLARWLSKPEAQRIVADGSQQALQQARPLPDVVVDHLVQQGHAVPAELQSQLHAAANAQLAVQVSAARCHALIDDMPRVQHPGREEARHDTHF